MTHIGKPIRKIRIEPGKRAEPTPAEPRRIKEPHPVPDRKKAPAKGG